MISLWSFTLGLWSAIQPLGWIAVFCWIVILLDYVERHYDVDPKGRSGVFALHKKPRQYDVLAERRRVISPSRKVYHLPENYTDLRPGQRSRGAFHPQGEQIVEIRPPERPFTMRELQQIQSGGTMETWPSH